MDERQKAYAEILSVGLLSIRAFSGRSELCFIEADHLHNIPSLIFETNEDRHRYYILQERSAYVAAFTRLYSLDSSRPAYHPSAEAWKVLAKCAGVELPDDE